MAKKKNKIKIQCGPLNFEPSTYPEAASAIAQILSDTLSRIQITDDSGRTLPLDNKTIAEYHPQYGVFKCKELDNFVKFAQNQTYKPARFKGVFVLLCAVATSEGAYNTYADHISADLEKLIQGKYVTYRTVTEKRKTYRHRTKTVRINYYQATQKAWDYITKTSEEKLTSFPTEYLYTMFKYCTGDAPERKAYNGAKAPRKLATMWVTRCVTLEKPESSFFDPIYDLFKPETFESKRMYLTPRAEAAAIKTLTKLVRDYVHPRWDRDYKKKIRTLRLPSPLQRALTKLVPKKDYAMLFSSGKGPFLKAIIEDTLTQQVESIK